MCDHSACSRVTGVDDIDHFDSSWVVWGSSGTEPLSTTPVDRITERSMRLCSSRMLPGHECRARAAMNSSEMAVIPLVLPSSVIHCKMVDQQADIFGPITQRR
jgi:hypothetical protein